MKDVLIIGGGVIGLAIARELHRRGVRKIAVVDKGEAGGEASWAAAGMLSPNIEADIGSVMHRFCRESLRSYPQFAEELLDETGIDIELDRSGTLWIALDDDYAETIRSYCGRFGDSGTEGIIKTKDEIKATEPGLSTTLTLGVEFPSDWQVENRKLLAALKRSAETKGIDLIEHIRVSDVLVKNGRVCGVLTNSGSLYADRIVLATGAWSSLIKIGGSPMPFRVRPIRGQMIWFNCGRRMLRQVIYGPRCYLVPRADGRLLVGSTTEDRGFENIVTEDAVESLANSARELCPALNDLELAGSWSGLRPCSEDEMPIIGGIEGYDGLFAATAHYRNGILLAPITARIVTDFLTSGKGSEYLDHFSPARFASSVGVAGC